MLHSSLTEVCRAELKRQRRHMEQVKNITHTPSTGLTHGAGGTTIHTHSTGITHGAGGEHHPHCLYKATQQCVDVNEFAHSAEIRIQENKVRD